MIGTLDLSLVRLPLVSCLQQTSRQDSAGHVCVHEKETQLFMKTFTKRSATLAACTVLLIAGTSGQASAADIDAPPPASPRTRAPVNITVTGNNNKAAGNDLVIGNDNVSGTGNNAGGVTDLPYETSCMYIQNLTDVNLTNGTASVDLDATITQALPEELDAGDTATVCARANYILDTLLTLHANYEIIGNTPAAFHFTMTNWSPGLPSYQIVQTGPSPSPYSAGLITRTTDGDSSNTTSFLIDCPGPTGCGDTASPGQQGRD
ncbi:hypothetical protein KJK32_44930 [Streptomyces sp. JCM17656]|nr:hypothetical protein KJK32_44930 [Streptomyces sp. JCM17656]